MFTNNKSYAVRVGDVVVAPGETVGAPVESALLARSKKSKKLSVPLEPVAPEGVELSEEDAK